MFKLTIIYLTAQNQIRPGFSIETIHSRRRNIWRHICAPILEIRLQDTRIIK